MEDVKKEFIDAYKESKFDKHLIKLFDKAGKNIVESDAVDDDKWFNELKLRINCFFQEALKLNTVSFLFGTGSSKPIGAESIYEIPQSICSKIKENGLESTCKKVVQCYDNKNCDEKAGCKINLEEFLGDLIRLENTSRRFAKTIEQKEDFTAEIGKLIEIIKEELHNICKVPNTTKIVEQLYKEDPLKVHKEFIKKILARPENLKRVGIFTTNYDLAFESAMDDLGVIYVDGFIGNTKRVFRPEVYNYDYYFPADTTEGKVHRLDKVIHLYKVHGSLNWIECEQSEKNIFGIEQLRDFTDYNKSILIYPQPMKEGETLGFPYSEMFRRFASVIQQPQNVLLVYGYGFGDEHINRLIVNALSISTFQLVVISYGWTPKLKKFYEDVKDEPRVSFLIGSYLGGWSNFVFDLLPDIKHLETEERIASLMKKLKGYKEEKERE